MVVDVRRYGRTDITVCRFTRRPLCVSAAPTRAMLVGILVPRLRSLPVFPCWRKQPSTSAASTDGRAGGRVAAVRMYSSERKVLVPTGGMGPMLSVSSLLCVFSSPVTFRGMPCRLSRFVVPRPASCLAALDGWLVVVGRSETAEASYSLSSVFRSP